ncbi:hypothetical protein ACSLFT_22470 [Streptomyces sp. G6]|uniref:hypothetical protein n=1 Tax=Streptomyces sp. G6 TaxID=1178736 RepID=UPI003EDB3F9B
MTSRRPAKRGEPRCYDKVVDEVTAADEFHDRLVARTLDYIDASLIWRAFGALSNEDDDDSPMREQALRDFGLRVRIRLVAALAPDVACPGLNRLGPVVSWEEDCGPSTWRAIESHVRSCQICSTYHEGRDILQLLRSPALARRVLAAAVEAYKGPHVYFPGGGGWRIPAEADRGGLEAFVGSGREETGGLGRR